MRGMELQDYCFVRRTSSTRDRGAARLGPATAKAFAESGASVVLADWNEKEVQAEAKKLSEKGTKTLRIRLRRLK